MRILFVAQYAPHREKLIPIHVQQLFDDLLSHGLTVDIFPFRQNNIYQKLKSYFALRKRVRKEKYDIIHCHFSYIGLAGLYASSNKNVIVSFLGSDLDNLVDKKRNLKPNILLLNFMTKLLLKKSAKLKGIIVKNENHLKLLKDVKCSILKLPNGVDLKKFHHLDYYECRKKLNIPIEENVVIFCSAKKDNPIKNLKLAKAAIENLKKKVKVTFILVTGKKQEEMALFFNSADVLLFTSLHEGSPNVIKEAMACDLPIVSTNVGDVFDRINTDNNSYIVDFDEKKISDKLETVLKSKNRSDGSSILLSQNLDNISVTKKLFNFYKTS